MNSFPTQKSKDFGIPLRSDHSCPEKRKIRNEYKTKKTAFQEGTAEIGPAFNSVFHLLPHRIEFRKRESNFPNRFSRNPPRSARNLPSFCSIWQNFNKLYITS